MPSIEPIKLYLEAVKKYRQGNNEDAANLLASALGAEKPSPVITNSLDKFLNYGSRPNDAVLQIIATEVSKSGGNNEQ